MRPVLALLLFPLLATAASTVVEGAWTNQATGRVIPYLARIPSEPGKRPTVLLSHGLGGTKEGLDYLGRYWAEHGYLVVHLQHAGSDSSIFAGMLFDRERAMKAATSVEEFKARVQDAKVALDRLRLTAGLAEHHDAGEVAIAGHSYGARTSMALSGERFPSAPGVDLSDPRIRAAVVLSPPPYSGADRFAAIGIPQFHVTGTKDTTPIEESQDPAMRLCPFRESTNSPSYLVVLDGADHMAFSGRLPSLDAAKRKTYARWHTQLAEATTRFLDATLRADRAARSWLDGDGLVQEFGAAAKVERRAAAVGGK